MKINKSGNYQTIFCERIVGMGVGASIAKLDFGNISDFDDEKSVEITATLVIPTDVLIKTLPVLLQQLNDPDTKESIKKNLHDIIQLFDELEK